MITYNQKKETKRLYGEGISQKVVAEMLDLSVYQVNRVLQKGEYKQMKIGRASLDIARNKMVRLTTDDRRIWQRRLPKNTTMDKVILDMFYKKELDFWFYPNSDKIGNYGIAIEPGDYRCFATQNIPYIEYNPAKTIHLVSHSLVEWKEEGPKGNKTWYGYSNFCSLTKPEDPLVSVSRHNVDTVNASLDLAETPEDQRFTALDACIISAKFAERMSINQTFTDTFSVYHPEKLRIGEGCKYDAGTVLEPENREFQVSNLLKYDTEMIVMQKDKVIEKYNGRDDLHIVTVRYKVNRPLSIGDKIRSLSGLKMIVGAIREQKADIVLNINQIYSKVAGKTKGAVVREIQECGKVMVGIRKDEIIGREESTTKGVTISSTVYPVMKIWDEEFLQEKIQLNSSWWELLLSLHLKPNKNGYYRLSDELYDMDNPNWKICPHYLFGRYWNKKERKWNSFEDVMSGKELTKFTTSTGTGETTRMEKFIWQYLYEPNFLEEFYIRKGAITYYPLHHPEKSPEGISWEDKDESLTHGKYPFLTSVRGKESQYEAITKNILFPRIKPGYSLKAVPQINHPLGTIVLSSQHKNHYLSGVIWREPVTGKKGVYSMDVVYDENIPFYCIGIAPEIIQEMDGDFDGDDIAFVPGESKPFIPEVNEIGEVKGDTEVILIAKIPIKPRTIREMREEGLVWLQRMYVRQQLVEDLGGNRKTASFILETEEEQKALLDIAPGIEDVLKPEKAKDIAVMKRLVSAKKVEIQELVRDRQQKIEQRNGGIAVEDRREMKMIASKPKAMKDRGEAQLRLLIGFRPPRFWRDLFVDRDPLA